MSTQDLGQYNAAVRQNGVRLNSNEPLTAAGTNTLSGATTISGATTLSGTTTVTGATTFTGQTTLPAASSNRTPVAINSTASATAAQIASGYITSTSAAGTTITMPTSTAIATAIGAGAGSTFEFYIDNTAGSNTVTLSLDSSQTKSQVAQVATYGVPTFGLFTVASGATGQAGFKLVFSSTTAATIARVF